MNESLTSPLLFVIYPITQLTLELTCPSVDIPQKSLRDLLMQKQKGESLWSRSEGYPGRWCDYTCCLSIKFNSVPFPCVSVLVGIMNYMAILQREDKQLLLSPGQEVVPSAQGQQSPPLGLIMSLRSSKLPTVCSCDSLEFFRSHRKLPWPCTPG